MRTSFRDLGAAALFLGVTEGSLRRRLRGGETLAEVAKAEGKGIDGLELAIAAAATKRLETAVVEGRMTRAQRDLVAASLRQRTVEIVGGSLPAVGGRVRFRFELPRSA